MKKILLIIPVLLLTGCVEIVENETTQTNPDVVVEETKPLTKQVCDWTGWDSAAIIQEQAEQGYIYTGRSNSFWCGDDMLNFQLMVK